MKLLRQIIKQKLTESIDDARISKLLSLAEEGYDRYLQAKSVALSLNLDLKIIHSIDLQRSCIPKIGLWISGLKQNTSLFFIAL